MTRPFSPTKTYRCGTSKGVATLTTSWSDSDIQKLDELRQWYNLGPSRMVRKAVHLLWEKEKQARRGATAGDNPKSLIAGNPQEATGVEGSALPVNPVGRQLR